MCTYRITSHKKFYYHFSYHNHLRSQVLRTWYFRTLSVCRQNILWCHVNVYSTYISVVLMIFHYFCRNLIKFITKEYELKARNKLKLYQLHLGHSHHVNPFFFNCHYLTDNSTFSIFKCNGKGIWQLRQWEEKVLEFNEHRKRLRNCWGVWWKKFEGKSFGI